MPDELNEEQVAALVAASDPFFDGLALIPNLRSATLTDMEMSEVAGGGFRYRGHAAVFDEVAQLGDIPGMGKATEEIKRGAFRKVLQLPDNIPLTLEHDQSKVLATTRSGRLKLSEDAKGLAVDADLADTSLARDLKALVDSGDVQGMSFGFVTGPKSTGNWNVSYRSSGVHRVITGFKKLLDVCATWDPTYVSATAQFRSLAVKYSDSPELLQQILLGAYPAQLEGGAEHDEEEEPAGGATPEEAATGVAEHRSVAARKRALSLIVLTTGGIDDHAS